MSKFCAGDNIAIKVPAHRYEATRDFYRDTVGLPLVRQSDDSTVFEFGSCKLWIDRVPHQSQTDVWLELRTPELDEAMRTLGAAGTVTRDELEPLGDLKAHWVSDPAGVVLLVHEEPE